MFNLDVHVHGPVFFPLLAKTWSCVILRFGNSRESKFWSGKDLISRCLIEGSFPSLIPMEAAAPSNHPYLI
jgi:hypothetical protein